jgi:cytochrome c553
MVSVALLAVFQTAWLQDGPSAAEPPGPFEAAARGDADLETGQKHYQQICAQCHGPTGEGNVSLKAPSIAHLPAWYVGGQIGKFQRDWRGVRPEDTEGNMMHAIARSLDPPAVRDVAGYIQSLPLLPTQVTLTGGDAAMGEELYRERCMECHRYNGRGEPAFRSSPLIGLQDWYIVHQLQKFRNGLRGSHENDSEGAKMHRVSGPLSDQSLLDLAAHIAELAKKYAEKPKP